MEAVLSIEKSFWCYMLLVFPLLEKRKGKTDTVLFFFLENLTAVTASMLSSLAAVIYFCGVSAQVGLLILECTEI